MRKLFMILMLCSLNAVSQDTFESGQNPWIFSSTSVGNSFFVGTNAGNGLSLPGNKSSYVSWNNSSYGALNSVGTCLMYKRYDNVCTDPVLRFDYKIKGGTFYPTNDSYYGKVVYSYDSLVWNNLDNDTLTTNNCYHWTSKSIPCSFSFSTVYIGFLFVDNADSISICAPLACAPLAIDNVLLTCNVSLPMKLTNFNPSYINGLIEISFDTESEINTKKFIVQYSPDAFIFEDLCEFDAAFMSYSKIHYEKHLTFDPTTPVTYFRILEKDIDAEFLYSIVCISTVDVEGVRPVYFDILGRESLSGQLQIRILKNRKVIETD